MLQIVTALGCGVVSDIHKATHLVTDEAKRTIKFMCAVSKGLHIVTTKWLTQSKKQAQLLGEWKLSLILYNLYKPKKMSSCKDCPLRFLVGVDKFGNPCRH